MAQSKTMNEQKEDQSDSGYFGLGVFVGIILGGLVCIPIGSLMGNSIGQEHVKNLTAEAGVAEYYIDKDFNKQWRIKSLSEIQLKDTTNEK